MKTLMQKTIPVALAALLTACGGGGGSSTDPLASLTYSGKNIDAKTTEGNMQAVAKEVVDFARAFITVSRFQMTGKGGLNFNDNVAGYWFDEDLYESDLACDSGTYKGSTIEKDEEIYDLNYKAQLSQCALTIANESYQDGSYIFDGSASTYKYSDTEGGSYYLIKNGYDYKMNVTADGEKIKKQGRGNYEKYYEYANYSSTLSEAFEFTTIIDVYGKSYKYTDDNGIALVKAPSGKVYKSSDIKMGTKNEPQNEDLHGRHYLVRGGDSSAKVYLPSFGQVGLISSPYETGSESPLKRCENDNFSAGTINVWGQDTDEESVRFKITFTECGKYTVSVVELD